jgi:hypothetical protein
MIVARETESSPWNIAPFSPEAGRVSACGLAGLRALPEAVFLLRSGMGAGAGKIADKSAIMPCEVCLRFLSLAMVLSVVAGAFPMR